MRPQQGNLLKSGQNEVGNFLYSFGPLLGINHINLFVNRQQMATYTTSDVGSQRARGYIIKVASVYNKLKV